MTRVTMARSSVDFAAASLSDAHMRARVWTGLCWVLAIGCGRSEPAKSAEPEPTAAESHAEPNGVPEPRSAHKARVEPQIEVEGEVGGLDQDAVDKVIGSVGRDLDRCWEKGVERNELVAGTIQLVVGVGGDGRAVYSYVKQSTLGDEQMQGCMLAALARRTFPKPVGGKVGIVRTSLSFDLASSARAPAKWSSTRVHDAVSAVSQEIAECKRGAGGDFTATVYVKQVELPPPPPAGDAGEDGGADAADAGPTYAGSAFSIGIAVPDEKSAAAAECLGRVLSKVVFPPPGDTPAKVTFPL